MSDSGGASDGSVVVQDQRNGGTVAASTAAAGGGEQPAARESMFSICKTLMVRAMLIYFITSMFRRPAQQPDSPAAAASARVAANLFDNGTLFDLHVFVSESASKTHGSESLVWQRRWLHYGDWSSGVAGDGVHQHETTLAASRHAQHNGSLFLHVYVVRSGLPLNVSAADTVHRCKKLTRHRRVKWRHTHNLLTGASSRQQDVVESQPGDDLATGTTRHQQQDTAASAAAAVPHWHPNITVSLVVDFTGWSRATLVPPLDQYVEFVPHSDLYRPIVFINDYWNLARDYQPVNDSVATLPLHITFQPIGLVKFQLYSSMNMRNKWLASLTGSSSGDDSDSSGGSSAGDDDEQDSLKEALLTTNVYLMALTVAISLLHSVFEFLAFKNDVQFWRRRDSLEGLSVRTVVFGVFQASVVLLYVLDQDTNTMIRLSCAIGLLIELWKVGRVTDVRVQWRAIGGCLPRVTIADKSSYVESSTRHYDRMAFRYVSWLVFPLFVGYAVYSLLYTEHIGWYSFVLSILYGFLLTFGFIMMTPQLFINYKLKSVAHLPWRMLTYKALNTFIDDIFAFVIRMPMMYRIGCLRDDVVFFIFLYQRYIYRVDPGRVNEFGFSQTMMEQTGDGEGDEAQRERSLPLPVTSSHEGDRCDLAVSGGDQAIKSAADKKTD